MIRFLFSAGLLLAALAVVPLAAQDIPKTPFDKLDSKKLPVAQRPTKSLPKDVLAVLGERDGRYDNVAFRSDGGQFATCGPDGQVRLWDAATLRITGTVAHKDVACLTFAPSGKTLVGGDATGNLKYWSIALGKLTVAATIPAHKGGPIWAIAFSPDGKTLCSGGADKTIKIWDASKVPPTLKATLTGHADRVRGLAISHDGKRLVSTSDRDKTVRVWDLGDQSKEPAKLTLIAGAACVAISPDDETLAAGCNDGAVHTWKFGDKPSDPETIRTDKGAVNSLVFSPDGKSLLGLVKWNPVEDRVFIWNREGKQRFEGKYGSHIEAVAYDPGGRQLLVVNESSLLVVRPKD